MQKKLRKSADTRVLTLEAAAMASGGLWLAGVNGTPLVRLDLGPHIVPSGGASSGTAKGRGGTDSSALG